MAPPDVPSATPAGYRAPDAFTGLEQREAKAYEMAVHDAVKRQLIQKVKACYRAEGVNYRKKCAAIVQQYEAVHRAKEGRGVPSRCRAGVRVCVCTVLFLDVIVCTYCHSSLPTGSAATTA